MKCMDSSWHEQDNPMYGYKWSIQAKYGTVVIDEGELFNRKEFQSFPSHEYKVAYAMDMGWRYNVDSGMWYRIRGF